MADKIQVRKLKMNISKDQFYPRWAEPTEPVRTCGINIGPDDQASRVTPLVGKISKLGIGARGFLVIVERGTNKTSRLKDIYDLFEQFSPGQGKSSTSGFEKVSRISLTGNVRSSILNRKPLRPSQHIGGETFGDGEHNADACISNTKLAGKQSAAPEDEPVKKKSRLSKSLVSIPSEDDCVNEKTNEGGQSLSALSAFQRKGETEEEFIKRLAHEEMEKYLSDDGLLRVEVPEKYNDVPFPSSSPNSQSFQNLRDEMEFDESTFVPKLTVKPNAIKCLELKAVVDPNTKKTYYEHPYKDELNRWTPSPALLHRSETQWLYRKVTETAVTVVHSPSKLENVLRELRGLKEFAFGVKYSRTSYFGCCCLLMISTRYKNYVIDCFNLKRKLESLNKFFTDPSVLKVGHDVTSDILFLQKDLGVYVVGLMDTNEVEKIIRDSSKSIPLGAILRKYFHYGLDNNFRDVDWSMRPVPKYMIEYARCETHYLLHLYDLQKAELLDRGSGEHLCQAFESSKKICLLRYEKPDRDSWIMKHRERLSNQQLYALGELSSLRDSIAISIDKCPSLVCSDKSLLELCLAMPTTWLEIRELKRLRKVHLTSFMERQKGSILRILEEAKTLKLVRPKLNDVQRTVVDQYFKTGISNLMFFTTKVPNQEEIARKIAEFYQENVFAAPSFVRRIIPVDTTCKKELVNIQMALEDILEEKAIEGSAYEVVSNFPYTKQHSLFAAIMTVVQKVKPAWLYSDECADICIIAYAVRDICGLSVVTDYRNCREFQLRNDNRN